MYQLKNLMVNLLQIGFAGDQLTAARARQAIDSRVNSVGQCEALRGFVPFACDWHAKANFIKVSEKRVFTDMRVCIADILG